MEPEPGVSFISRGGEREAQREREGGMEGDKRLEGEGGRRRGWMERMERMGRSGKCDG